MGRLAKMQKYNREADMAEVLKFSSVSKIGQPVGRSRKEPKLRVRKLMPSQEKA